MTEPARNLDYAAARDLPEEQAAIFYLGPSKLVTPGVVFLPAFANVSAFDCGDAVLVIDTAQQARTPRVLQDLRDNYLQAPIGTVVYTHGHVDHATGGQAILDHSAARGDQRPRFIAHKALPARFDRYKLLAARTTTSTASSSTSRLPPAFSPTQPSPIRTRFTTTARRLR